jgi:hypothetical protein
LGGFCEIIRGGTGVLDAMIVKCTCWGRVKCAWVNQGVNSSITKLGSCNRSYQCVHSFYRTLVFPVLSHSFGPRFFRFGVDNAKFGWFFDSLL